ncbi:MAG TPA: hydantoinase/oxoprolinase family protein [Burkholderiales bacterium]|nr:hydantoinase/oxoprolinase family protein [Burkholderiales bacterium]
MDTSSHRLTLGVDIGGTFTDLVLLRSDGRLFSKKVLSTPEDYSKAIESGILDLLAEVHVPASAIAELAHGTTVATNAIIERRGVRVALVTTKGFRDVLEIARFRSPRLYDLNYRKPEPLVERRLRLQVRERTMSDGTVLAPVNTEDLDAAARVIRDNAMDAVAICFINSYANPANELAASRYLAQALPGLSISASTQLLPQINEYERTSTIVVNAYIRPVVERYVRSLEERLRRIGIPAPLMIMQSSGGLLPGPLAAKNPVYVIESGPAGGVVGAQRLGQSVDLGDLIVFDMGGTTAKASLIQGGAYGLCPETEVGGGAALGHRLIQGAGYVVQVPTIDIAEVGAGGGSIATVDAAGGMQVGPRSAGAEPGPACYNRGGTAATVTDANVLLGYLNPDALCGGELPIVRAKAQETIAALGQRMNLDVIDTAYGIHLIANSNMMKALHGVSTERGRDASQFGLLAIGGNGGVHAANLAETLRITRIVVPPVAGLFSALGMLFADVEHHLVAAFYRRYDTVTAEDLTAAAGPLVDEARRLLQLEGFPAARQHITLYGEMKHVAQSAALTVAIEGWPVAAESLTRARAAFGAAHEASYGYRSDTEPLQFVALKVIGQGISETPRVPERLERDREDRATQASRNAYFGRDLGWHDTPVIARNALDATPLPGPLIVEEYDTTTVVRPGWSARLDRWNNIIVERAPKS